MPQIDITYPDGRTESRRLSRRSPIVIGSNPICDVHIDDEGIPPIHCRIHYRDKTFEVAATASEPIDVNGTLVKNKALAADDVIRVGGADLVVRSSKRSRHKRREEGAREASAPAAAAASGSGSIQQEGNSSPRATVEFSEADWDALAEGADAEPAEGAHEQEGDRPEQAQAPASPEPDDQPAHSVEEPAASAADSEFNAAPVLIDEEKEAKAEAESSGQKPGGEKPATTATPKWKRMRRRRRPGEQDILTSPLVLGLGGFALFLLLAAGAIWLLIGREAADRLYAAARADRQSGRYTQAIAKFERFLLNYPTDSRVVEARHLAGLTRIERHASGATPDYEKALAAFDRFVRNNRDGQHFEAIAPELASLAGEIASGASAAAIRTGRRPYLQPAETGLKLFVRYAQDSPSVKERRGQLETGLEQARAAVRKQEYYEKTAATIESALEEKDFVAAYQARRELLVRYPDLRQKERIADLLTQALAAERKAITRLEDPQAESRSADGQARPPVLTLIGHTQARVGEQSDGRKIIALAGDQLFGLDVVTGRPLWSTTIGTETPFFPIEVDAEVPALLAFDAAREDLVLIARESGEVLWRTHIGRLAAGPPRIAQGQIDLVTTDGHLVRLTLAEGKPIAALEFPQPLTGSPIIMADRQYLVVFGEQASAYVLDYRTLEPRSVSFIGHARGALAVAPRRLGRLIVTFENDGLDSATIRALSFEPPDSAVPNSAVKEGGALTTLATAPVTGTIETPPESFGNVLYVPSSMERITAYSVSDDPGTQALTRLAGVQIAEPVDVPTFLAPGSDGMLWAAGSALRQLHLVAEDLTILPESLAPGRHTQPVQQSGEGLFVARRLPSSRAIYVSQADRSSMTGSWRSVLGANLIASAAAQEDLTLVTGAGQVATITPEALGQSDFVETSLLPDWQETADAPLGGTTLDDGTGLVWQAGKQARLWRIRPNQAVSRPREIPAAPQTDPVRLAGGMVLPVPGELVFLTDSGESSVDPYVLPITNDQQEPPNWISLVALDEETMAALSGDGQLRIIRRRAEPAPYLAQIAVAELSQPTEHPLATARGDLFVIQGNRIEKRDPAGLRPLSERTLPGPITAGPWVVGESVVVQAGEHVAFLSTDSLKPRFDCSLESPLAGAPVRLGGKETSSGWLLAGRDGTILLLDEKGKQRRRDTLARRLEGLIRFSGQPLAVAIGGAVIPIPLSETSQTTPSADGQQEEQQ